MTCSPTSARFCRPVGRLDLDTSGLLLLTNDNQFAERVTNPVSHVPKTYLVKASVVLTDAQLQRLRDGIELDDGPTRPAIVKRLRDSAKYTHFEITLTEGRNRQVRRMVEALDAHVLKLVRVKIGPLAIGKLPIGKWRLLTRCGGRRVQGLECQARPSAASTGASSRGWKAKTACSEAISMGFTPRRAAISRCFAGGMTLSSVQST